MNSINIVSCTIYPPVHTVHMGTKLQPFKFTMLGFTKGQGQR